MWLPLEELYGLPAVNLLGEETAEAGTKELPRKVTRPLEVDGVDVVRPRRSTVSEQRGLLTGAVRQWLEMGDVAVAFSWTKVPAIRFGSYSLFGALALQVALAVARSQGLAVCMSCGRAYPPTRRPAPNRNNYCQDCGKAAAKRDWAAEDRRNPGRTRRKRKTAQSD
jgi:hypothetical protein